MLTYIQNICLYIYNIWYDVYHTQLRLLKLLYNCILKGNLFWPTFHNLAIHAETAGSSPVEKGLCVFFSVGLTKVHEKVSPKFENIFKWLTCYLKTTAWRGWKWCKCPCFFSLFEVILMSSHGVMFSLIVSQVRSYWESKTFSHVIYHLFGCVSNPS